MPRKSKTEMEQGFLRSFWSEIHEMEREHRRAVSLAVTATSQPGVFMWRMVALGFGATDEDDIRRDMIQRRYPDGGSWTLAGFMWELARRLCDQVVEGDASRAAQGKGE